MPLSQRVTMIAASRTLAFILLLILSDLSIVKASSSDVPARSHSISTRPNRKGWSSLLHTREEPQSIHEFEAWEVICLYPVSGTYCKPQRILVDCVAVLTFCLRFHAWFTAVGVSFLMSYTTVAAIHGCALMYDWRHRYDSDSIIMPFLLPVNLVMAMNFHFFIPRLFQASKRWIITVWTFMLIFAFIFILFLQSTGTLEPQEYAGIQVCTNWSICVFTCGTSTARPMFRGSNEQIVPIIRRELGIQVHNTSLSVADPWILAEELAANLTDRVLSSEHNGEGIFILDHLPGTPKIMPFYLMIGWTYRVYVSGVNHSPKFTRDFIFRQFTKKNSMVTKISLQTWAECFIFYIWPLEKLYCFVQCILSVIPSWRSTECSCDTFPCQNITKSYCLVAKVNAAISFAFLSVYTFVLPTLFIKKVVDTELHIAAMNLPEQETPFDIGQWGTWISIGLALLVVIGHRIVTSEKKTSQDSSLWMFRGERRIGHGHWAMWKRDLMNDWYHIINIREMWNEFAEWWKDPMAISWGEALTDGDKIWELSEITVRSYPQLEGTVESGRMLSTRFPRSNFHLA